MTWLLALLLWQSTGGGEPALRRALQATGTVHLPPGVYEITREIELRPNSHDLVIDGTGATLRLGPNFIGRAAFVCLNGRNIAFRNLTVEGNRDTSSKSAELAPSDVAFSRFTVGNGLLIDESNGVNVDASHFAHIAGFAVLVNHSRQVHITGVHVADSGSENLRHRNNSTGGILLEEGTSGFEVTGCELTNVRGNGIWTHSLYTSPRNTKGHISGNKIVHVGRDAIQVGHATDITVEHNAGAEIGYPVETVDVESRATPVAIDTAGNVDASTYRDNHFEEVNGKCIDLDGFHDGEVSGNSCANHEPRTSYPQGNFGIVLNNSNPDMRSKNVRIVDNTIDGWLYGGIVVIGTGHTIRGNHLLRLNLAHCNDEAARFGCLYLGGEPDVLRSGIYLRKGNHRPDPATGNHIENNEISGYGMSHHCIGVGPGVAVQSNVIDGNECTDEGDVVARQ
jgi:Right handed beta helix region